MNKKVILTSILITGGALSGLLLLKNKQQIKTITEELDKNNSLDKFIEEIKQADNTISEKLTLNKKIKEANKELKRLGLSKEYCIKKIKKSGK